MKKRLNEQRNRISISESPSLRVETNQTKSQQKELEAGHQNSPNPQMFSHSILAKESTSTKVQPGSKYPMNIFQTNSSNQTKHLSHSLATPRRYQKTSIQNTTNGRPPCNESKGDSPPPHYTDEHSNNPLQYILSSYNCRKDLPPCQIKKRHSPRRYPLEGISIE